MRDDRARTVDLRVDRIVVRAHGSRLDAARELGAALAHALPAALAGAAERAHGTSRGGPVEFATLPVHVKNAPRAADVAAAAGAAAAVALAGRLGAPKGGVR